MPLDPLYDRMLRTALRRKNAAGEEFLVFQCPKHGVDVGDFSAAPTNSCEECWWMFYMKLQDVAQPKDRAAIADRLCIAVAEADQAAREGRWDYVPYKHPRLTQVDGDTDLDLGPQRIN